MLTLYCDDSGTHAQSPVAVAACYVAPVLQWEHFVKDWNSANEAENFGVFHMADFVAKKEQFARPEWLDNEKRKRIICRLINIIGTRAKHGFFSAIEKEGYDREVPQEFRDKRKLGNNHYTFAVRMAMAKMLKWRMTYGYTTQPIEFVFDQLSKGKGEINQVFEAALKEGAEKALLHGVSRDAGWSFQSKAKILPLQAADILAWESLHYMQKVFLPEEKEKPRKSYLALLEKPLGRSYHDGESLRRWVAAVKERTGGRW
jgi:hypothetical protein